MNFLFSPAFHASHVFNIPYICKTTIATLRGSLEKVSPRIFKTSPKNLKLDSQKSLPPFYTPSFEYLLPKISLLDNALIYFTKYYKNKIIKVTPRFWEGGR